MIEFINASCTITLNHNQSTTAHNKSSAEPLTAEDSLHSRSYSTTDLNSSNFALYSLGADPTENTVSQQFVGVFTAPLPRNGRLIFPRYVSARTCLATRCLVTGMVRTTEKTLLAVHHCYVCVFRSAFLIS
jgi:hypothetical protein